ncbi:hypothetical protein NDU88_005955 [Pleurodeles waltl]|uniref:Uncharacterized protein n=1 Tax=Pleurodeles waltl TaxID=8319 RepID=A0AAV7PJM6_PLEWA|nr:hypothetical protein NDU88_005955 [Pleurodeles waltl]
MGRRRPRADGMLQRVGSPDTRLPAHCGGGSSSKWRPTAALWRHEQRCLNVRTGPPVIFILLSAKAMILVAIEASGQAVQTQIAAIAVDVNMLRTDLRAVAKRPVATEKQEVAWGWLELRGGGGSSLTPSARGGPGDVRRASDSMATTRRKSRQCRRDSTEARMIVRPDGFWSLEQRRQKREEARMLVEAVTSVASSRMGSLQGEEGPALDLDDIRT